ncbi:MAG: PASTA domain-containing protein [Armatimonadetes bacterium]|nr:MAG: PASTA domain-containing protein [Armatimonadota bacterium]
MKHRRVLFIAVPIAILLLPLGIYLVDRAVSDDVIARNVTVAGVEVGGLNTADATVAVERYEGDLRASTGVFKVNDATFKLSPVEIGLDADIPTAITAASSARKTGGPIARFAAWIVSFSKQEDIPLDITFDEEAIDDVFTAWERTAVADPAFEGAVTIEAGVVTPQYPATGQGIDRAFARTQVQREMSRLDKSGVVVPVIVIEPVLTDAQIDAAAAELAEMINDPIHLISTDVGFRVTFTPEQLASAAVAEVSEDGTEMVTRFDAETVLKILEPRKSEYEIPPVNAQLDVDFETDVISVVAGRSGTLLDVEGLMASMKEAALGSGTGEFPLIVGAEPDLTTAEAQALTSLKPLGGFTTHHPARQNRVINIQTMADEVDGAIVEPGAVFSLNEYVGPRTEAKGYVADGAIINGVPYCCDHPANIGGGVSQFGTTFFNAVFFSCLEDVEHQPHSLYFDRYPMGREATLGVPGPDVAFRNNTESPVIIKTAYTDTSITVRMYGDNGGLTCTDVTYEKEDIVKFEEELVADELDEIVPGEREKERSGSDGFLVRVDRVVTRPDGSQETDMKLVWRYRPLTELYTVHPCEVTGEPVNCPVQLPSLTDKTWEEALGMLDELGLLAAKTTGFVDDPEKDNIVLTQDPAPGEWVPLGSTIKLTVGVFQEE